MNNEDKTVVPPDNNINDLANRALSDTPVGQRPTLRQGDTGQWVEELQRELTQLTFYDGPIDGTFGASTNTAVRAFQTNNKLTVDGIVGRATWSALIFLYAPLAICGGSGSLPSPFKGLVIDPGHGGTDPGASANDLIEKNLTLAISMYQNDRFYELNIPHFMTRTTDETLNPEERIARIKSGFGDQKGVLLLSNHINAGGGEGAEVIYALRSTNKWPTMILSELGLAGQKTRRVYQRALSTNPNLDYYYIMRDTTNIEPVIVEYGFLDNVADATRLRYNWKRYAEAVVKATCDYIGYPYSPPYEDAVIYTVVSGDTLFSIAQRFQTTVSDIMSLNNLTNNVISIGQRLKIPFFGVVPPTAPETTFTHTVVAGDTLFALAQRFNTTVAEIKRINNLTSDTLSIGQQLEIPITGETPTPPPTTPSPGERPILKYGDRGDYVRELQTILAGLGFAPGTIDGIFGNATLNAVKAFQTANGLTVDGIVGPVTWNILLNASPTPPPQYITHTVIRGDTLFSLAQRFNTTVDAIIKLNNLTSTALSIGQQLLIPVASDTIPPITHTVAAGDTLFSLAQRFNTTVDAIMKLNNLTSTALSIGQQLLIPST